MGVMKIRIAAAGAALFAGLIMNAGLGTPAWAICLPLWGTICRDATSPSADTAAAPEAKPHKPLNLRALAHKGGKRTHVAARHRQPTVSKRASHNMVAARARVATARRFASAKRRPHIEARRQEAAKLAARETVKTPPISTEQASQLPANAAPDGAASSPQTDGYVPSQNEVTSLDLAADQSKPAPPAAEAPNAALWNAVTPTDPAANAGVDPSADDAKIAPATNQPATNQVAAADAAHPVEVAAPAQQPADEPSWLRRLLIGAGGVLTLASVVRLFIG
jgi:hypothetical protein